MHYELRKDAFRFQEPSKTVAINNPCTFQVPYIDTPCSTAAVAILLRYLLFAAFHFQLIAAAAAAFNSRRRRQNLNTRPSAAAAAAHHLRA